MRGRCLKLLFAAVLVAGCAETKYVPDGRYLLDEVKVTVDGHNRDITPTRMKSYVRQQANAQWLSMA